MKHLLTIAGSDSSGGAGIQADLKTFAAHGVFGMSVITAVTAQNTCGVTAVQDISPDIITAQIDAVFSDIRVDAVKIGMVSRTESIHAIAEALKKWKPPVIVVDPVMISKSGYPLLQPEACDALIKELLPLATLLTPNLPEAEAICGFSMQSGEPHSQSKNESPAENPSPFAATAGKAKPFSIKTEHDMEKAAAHIISLGAEAVLVKGGHLEDSADDYLYDGKQGIWLPGTRIQTQHTHGTGCTLSSALASNLAKGLSLEEAVKAAKQYVTTAIQHGIALGHGHGPTHHFVELWEKTGLGEE
jgi:hydroxymethylpyrimidine/phosphomethylpyrimidine kinase